MRLRFAFGVMGSLWLGLASVQESAGDEASTNAASAFKLLSVTPAAQVTSVPASGAEARGVLRLPTVQVAYSGISASWAHRMGRVLSEARSHAQREFGFNMPDMIRLAVTTGSDRYELFNDTREQLTYHLRSESDLAGFEWHHWYFLYGMSHEVAHLSMYRSFDRCVTNGWLNWDAQEAWAHYLGARLADLSYAQCVSEFWPGLRLEGEQTLKADRESAQSSFPVSERALADQWRSLADIVGDRGFEPLFVLWNQVTIGPQHSAVAVSRTFTDYPQAERLQGWWLKAAPLMLTQPGKSPFPPTGGPNSASGGQPRE